MTSLLKRKHFSPSWLPLLAALLLSTQAQATGFDFGALNNATNGAVESILKTVGIGADHKPYASARNLGLLIGLDLGVDVTLLSLPKEFSDALALMGNTTSFPDAIPLPRLSLRKGLPWNFDLGFSYIGVDVYRILGFDLQWQGVEESPLMPALAVRASWNRANLDVVKTTSKSIDLIASKNFLLIEPYLGVGFQLADGTLEVPQGGAGGLPVGVSKDQSFSGLRYFIGVPLKLWILHLTGEYASSSTGIQTTGLKVSLSL